MELQSGADQLHGINALQLSLAEGAIQRGELPVIDERSVNRRGRGHRLPCREDTELERPAADTEAHRSRIVAGRSADLGEIRAGRIGVQRGATADEEFGPGHRNPQQVALEQSTWDRIGIDDPADLGTADIDGRRTEDHIGDAQAHATTDAEGRIGRPEGDQHARDRTLSPVEHLTVGHRGLVELQLQILANNLHRIHPLQLSTTHRTLEARVLAEGGQRRVGNPIGARLAGREDAQVQRTAFHAEAHGARVITGGQQDVAEGRTRGIDI